MSVFAKPSSLIVVLLVAGAVVRPAADAASLTFDLVDRINWENGDQMPSLRDAQDLLKDAEPTAPAEAMPAAFARVTERYEYDARADTVSVTVRFEGRKNAPVAPMLALAKQYGFPVEFDRTVATNGRASLIGPVMWAPGTDSYTWRIKGLGRYVNVRTNPRPGGAAPELQKQLETEASRILAAGPLAPWLALANMPGSGATERGDVYWDNPAETLWILADVKPLLPAAMQDGLQDYMDDVREAFPPEAIASVPFARGTRREYCPPDDALLAQWQDKILAYRTKNKPGVWNLYGLARYYEAAGKKPDAPTMAAIREIVNRQMTNLDWPTLYWRRGSTPHFNAVHGVNQLFAGFIGYIRLARLAGDTEAETLGWGLLARASALRYAMGKYVRFMHEHRYFNIHYRIKAGHRPETSRCGLQTDPAVFLIPQDPAWWAKAGSKHWMGNLLTWRWTSPADDVRQVHRLDETGVDVWEWCGVDHWGDGQKRDEPSKNYWYMITAPYQLPFRDLTPELAAFLADHLKAECAAYSARVEENQPHWHLTYAEAILGQEVGYNSPADAYSHFLARAWILRDPPRALERRVDVPWVKQGDLFHLHKLAVTVASYR